MKKEYNFNNYIQKVYNTQNEYFERKAINEYGHGITFVDIDETLFKTFAKIKVIKNGAIVRELTNQQFNTYQLKAGEEYDYGEFRDAQFFRKTSIPIEKTFRRIKKMINRIMADEQIKSKIILLTARADFNDKEEFLAAFRDQDVPIDNTDVIYIERAGNIKTGTVSQIKKNIVLKYLKTGLYRRCRMIDDDITNIKTFKKLGENIPDDVINAVKKRYPHLQNNTKEKVITFYPLLIDGDGNLTLINGDKQDINEAKKLSDIKKIKYSPESDLGIISSFMSDKLQMLNLGDTLNKGEKEIRFFQQVLSDNPSIQIPTIKATRVYISGPMTGHPYANYITFYLAEAVLRAGGIKKQSIINPATIDHPQNAGWVDFMRNDLAGMFTHTDMLMLLPGWESSLGARVEYSCANSIYLLKNIIKRSDPTTFNKDNINEDEKFSGGVKTDSVSGKNKAIFNSKEFQSVMYKIAYDADVEIEYVTEIFKAQKVFDAVKKASSAYKTQLLTQIIDLNKYFKMIADAIKSLNIVEENTMRKIK